MKDANISRGLERPYYTRLHPQEARHFCLKGSGTVLSAASGKLSFGESSLEEIRPGSIAPVPRALLQVTPEVIYENLLKWEGGRCQEDILRQGTHHRQID